MRTTLLMLFLFLMAGSFTLTTAQDIGTEPPLRGRDGRDFNLKDRLFFGGGLGAQFGSFTFISVSPLVGIKLTERWNVGTRFNYNYMRLRYQTYSYSDHIVGVSAFTRYFFTRNIFGHTEYETLNGDWKMTGERFNVNTWFLGGGYFMPMGNRSGIAVQGLFNLTPSIYSPYVNPIITMGLVFGI